MQRIFVETTIQVQRLLHDPSSYSTIQAILQTHQTITSTYVWIEVQRTLGQDYQYLIDLLLTKQPTTISELMRHVGSGEQIYSTRRLKRVLQIMAYWLARLNTSTIEPIETAYLLRRQCRRLLHREFFDHITQVVNPTICDLIQPDYTIPPGGRMSCRRETARCSLHKLLDENGVAIQNLRADPTALKVLDANTRRALAEITSDSTMAKCERNCWSLSDLIIVLECPPNAALWTTNLRHFEPLCRVVGRQLFQPTTSAI